mmetsp:Transcript_7216/g.8734  ORF Transcript_7216/g.8734 Transcript_7216/m.8734 type:complete len:183 (+) Transcript_7216:258-806(+)
MENKDLTTLTSSGHRLDESSLHYTDLEVKSIEQREKNERKEGSSQKNKVPSSVEIPLLEPGNLEESDLLETSFSSFTQSSSRQYHTCISEQVNLDYELELLRKAQAAWTDLSNINAMIDCESKLRLQLCDQNSTVDTNNTVADAEVMMLRKKLKAFRIRNKAAVSSEDIKILRQQLSSALIQ